MEPPEFTSFGPSILQWEVQGLLLSKEMEGVGREIIRYLLEQCWRKMTHTCYGEQLTDCFATFIKSFRCVNTIIELYIYIIIYCII